MTGTGPLAGKNVCDFGGGNPYLPIQSVAGMSIPVYMQWNDPFPGSFNDYNIYLIDPTKTSVINGSNSVQNSASSDPIEAFAYSSTSARPFRVPIQMQLRLSRSLLMEMEPAW